MVYNTRAAPTWPTKVKLDYYHAIISSPNISCRSSFKGFTVLFRPNQRQSGPTIRSTPNQWPPSRFVVHTGKKNPSSSLGSIGDWPHGINFAGIYSNPAYHKEMGLSFFGCSSPHHIIADISRTIADIFQVKKGNKNQEYIVVLLHYIFLTCICLMICVHDFSDINWIVDHREGDKGR